VQKVLKHLRGNDPYTIIQTKNERSNITMNILYIHGLDSKLNAPKKTILETYGRVFAPDIDYYGTPNAISSILEQYAKVDINTVIGSSMGGFAGYYIADALNRPALLFNPALKYRPVEQIVPPIEGHLPSFKQIVIGQRDDIVKPADTLSFLAEDLNRFTDYHIILQHEMQHRVEISCFEGELEAFFGKICY